MIHPNDQVDVINSLARPSGRMACADVATNLTFISYHGAIIP